MKSALVALALAQAVVAAAAPSIQAEGTTPMTVARSNDAIVDKAFADWQSAKGGSFYDVLTECVCDHIRPQSA